MIRLRPSFAPIATVACLCLLLASGCGVGTDGAAISGTVVCNGKPVPVGRVVFSSAAATCAGEIVDGEYQIMNKGYRKVPLADFTITVCPPANVYNPCLLYTSDAADE